MKFYYTAGNCSGKISDKDKSLGGYISTSVIPNGGINSLFNSFAYSTVNKSQTKGVILKNEVGNATNLIIQVLPAANTNYKLEVAIVAPAFDSKNNPYMEQIDSPYYQPYTAVFVPFTGGLNLGSLALNSYLGFWFKLSLLTNPFASLTCDSPLQSFGEEIWEITLTWS